ncbi:hypothetical protein ADUPG1_006114 [Aduncisulcus paluster]|uniref:Reverse transcriptase/retrotransposon-derived protein RNase H-like domain-containing protein n=1 Tax=Aduncisulcus paluster TaxID=2918883 RepID=A0ABQ5KLE1_9EUKA|nr:hypothetical protein ADUPG1_006114 [Aduncisulcus paluster]
MKSLSKVMLDSGAEHSLLKQSKMDKRFIKKEKKISQRDSKGRKISTKRLEALNQIQPPRTKKGVRRMMGTLNYLRDFIPRYVELTQPISDLLKEKGDLTWGKLQKDAWKRIVLSLEGNRELFHYNPDCPLILRTDASNQGLGGALIMIKNGKEVPILFFAKKFTEQEKHWCTLEQDTKKDAPSSSKTVLTTEAAPAMPRLEELTSETWIDFMADHEHYTSLGGHKKWPELVDVTVLDIIKDLSKVPDFRTTATRKTARTAVDKIFGASTTIDLYDELRRIRMRKELSINALLTYTKEFKGVRNRVPKLGEEKSIGDHFVEGLFTGRLKECVRAQMSDVTTLGSLIGIAIVELKKIIESERTHEALEKEKHGTDTQGHQRRQGKPVCRLCGKTGHVEANYWHRTGKRRFGGSQLKEKEKKPTRGARWIPIL